MDLNKFRQRVLEDEAGTWAEVLELKELSPVALREKVRVVSREREEALVRGVEVVQGVLKVLEAAGFDPRIMEPGHGSGHLTRDYVHALQLLSRLEADPRDIFIGLVAGTLHDIGCAFIERYAEAGRAVRHAEVGALALDQVFREASLGLNEAEQKLIQYAVAAHTHYLKPSEVLCGDGVKRQIEPYVDMGCDGQPIFSVWLPRWIDRLEINGPGFVARHFLTLATTHKDWSGKDFFTVEFAGHLRPLLRTDEDIKTTGGNRTMLEHLFFYYRSQSNGSPYGQYDYGRMVELRERQKGRLNRIIEMAHRQFAPLEPNRVLKAWQVFLENTIEPTTKHSGVAQQLCADFTKLDDWTKNSWLDGFDTVMREYVDWSRSVLEDLKVLNFAWRHLPAVAKDVEGFICPKMEWTGLLYL